MTDPIDTHGKKGKTFSVSLEKLLFLLFAVDRINLSYCAILFNRELTALKLTPSW
jgi:hypothetical protein